MACTGQPSTEVPMSVGIGVEAGGDAQQRAPAGEVRQHRMPQPAESDQSYVLAGGAVEQVLDAGQASVELIAAVGASRVADHHEVSAHLRGADAGEVGELVRVDAGGAGLLEIGEQTAIPAEPLHRLSRDHGFSGRCHVFPNVTSVTTLLYVSQSTTIGHASQQSEAGSQIGFDRRLAVALQQEGRSAAPTRKGIPHEAHDLRHPHLAPHRERAGGPGGPDQVRVQHPHAAWASTTPT